MALTISGWISMFVVIVLLWGTASWAIYRSLRDEDRKLELLEEQGEIDTYSPKALADLKEWIRSHPDDPHTETARSRYNECIEILRRRDVTFYEWDDREVESLEKL